MNATLTGTNVQSLSGPESNGYGEELYILQIFNIIPTDKKFYVPRQFWNTVESTES